MIILLSFFPYEVRIGPLSFLMGCAHWAAFFPHRMRIGAAFFHHGMRFGPLYYIMGGALGVSVIGVVGFHVPSGVARKGGGGGSYNGGVRRRSLLLFHFVRFVVVCW